MKEPLIVLGPSCFAAGTLKKIQGHPVAKGCTKQYSRGRMRIKSNQLLISDDGKIILGTGRMKILESIERTGSINKTARELSMAYKTVWSKLKSTQENFGEPVVVASRETGTRLTRSGKRLLEQYQALKQRCMEADDGIFEEIFNQGKS